MSGYLTVDDHREKIKKALALLNAGGAGTPYIVNPTWEAIKMLAPFIVIEQVDQFVAEFQEAIKKNALTEHWAGERSEIPESSNDESELQLFLDEIEQDVVIGELLGRNKEALQALRNTREQVKAELRESYGV